MSFIPLRISSKIPSDISQAFCSWNYSQSSSKSHFFLWMKKVSQGVSLGILPGIHLGILSEINSGIFIRGSLQLISFWESQNVSSALFSGHLSTTLLDFLLKFVQGFCFTILSVFFDQFPKKIWSNIWKKICSETWRNPRRNVW